MPAHLVDLPIQLSIETQESSERIHTYCLTAELSIDGEILALQFYYAAEENMCLVRTLQDRVPDSVYLQLPQDTQVPIGDWSQFGVYCAWAQHCCGLSGMVKYNSAKCPFHVVAATLQQRYRTVKSVFAQAEQLRCGQYPKEALKACEAYFPQHCKSDFKLEACDASSFERLAQHQVTSKCSLYFSLRIRANRLHATAMLQIPADFPQSPPSIVLDTAIPAPKHGQATVCVPSTDPDLLQIEQEMHVTELWNLDSPLLTFSLFIRKLCMCIEIASDSTVPRRGPTRRLPLQVARSGSQVQIQHSSTQ